MDALRRGGLTVLTVGILFSARTVNAHGHDMSKVAEGEYVSAEPIVRNQKEATDMEDTDTD